MKIKYIKKLNNTGSTLVLVLVIVSFIAILSTVCITTAMLNLKMKTVDREAKKTFYTAEEAIDEIYTGLGKLSMEMLDTAYKEELQSITRQVEVGVGTTKTKVNRTTGNIEANIELRQKFTKYMTLKMINYDSWLVDDEDNILDDHRDKLILTLNSYLENNKKAKVKSIGKFVIKKSISSDPRMAVYTIKFGDCVIEYVDEKGYFAHVTINASVALPDAIVQFTEDASNKLKPFDYALIGNSSIEIGQYNSLNIISNMYAGGSGLNLYPSSKVDATASTIVASTSINLNGATLNTSKGSSIWATDIFAKSGKTSDTNVYTKSEINIGISTETGDEKCKTYLKDDLQIDGDNSTVNVNGDYYGYSYEGDTVDKTSEAGHINSSAIIVNGQGASVDLSKISTLVIGGRAYIDYKEAGITPYMTGESLALKGNQAAYLVPGSFITYINNKIEKKLSNPFSHDYILNYSININENNFFGFKYLNQSNPFNAVTIDDDVYVYLNFKSKNASADYFKTILNDDVFRTILPMDSNGVILDIVKYNAYVETRNYMKSIIEVNMAQLAQTSIVNKKTSNIYTNGSLIYADLDLKTASEAASFKYDITGDKTVDSFSLNSLDLSNRYSLISKILYTPDMYRQQNGVQVRNIQYDKISNDIIIDGEDVDISGITANVFTNFINKSYLDSYYLLNSTYKTTIDSDKIMFATTQDITISNSEDNGFKNITGGIIITSGDVILEKSFNGIIIAGGKIVVNKDVYVTNKIGAYSTIEEFLDEDSNFKNFFKAWNSTSTIVDESGKSISIAGTTFKDIIKFTEWRKTDVTNIKGH